MDYQGEKGVLSNKKTDISPDSCPSRHLLDFELHCDASKLEIRSVLSQHGRLVAFFSERLAAARGWYITFDVKFYAIVQAIKNWRHY